MKDAELTKLIRDEVKAQVNDVLDNKVTLDFETFAKRDMQQGVYEKLKEGYKYVGLSHRPCTVTVNTKYKSVRYFNLSNEHDVQLFYKTLTQDAANILSVTATDSGPFTGGVRTGRHVDSMCAPTLKDGTHFPDNQTKTAYKKLRALGYIYDLGSERWMIDPQVKLDRMMRGMQREQGRVRMTSKATSDEWRIKLDGKLVSANAAAHAMGHMVRNGYEWSGSEWVHGQEPLRGKSMRELSDKEREHVEKVLLDIIRDHGAGPHTFPNSMVRRIMMAVSDRVTGRVPFFARGV